MRDGRPEAIVLGGGLAGIAAACRLLEGGCAVTLVERRPFLGGRSYSVRDQHTGVEVDNGQHVFMGCCREYIGLLQRLGVYGRTRLQKRLRLLVGRPGAALAALASSPTLGPLHLLPSFMSYPYLSLRDKLLVLYGLASIRRTSAERRRSLDDLSFYEWLVAHRQTERAIRRFWNLVVQPALNDEARLVSADLALMVFQEGLLGPPANAAIGYATVGLSRLLAQEAQSYIEGRGGRLLLGRSAARLLCDGGAADGVALADGEVLRGDFYVAALPHHVLPSLLPQEVRRSPFFAPIEELGSSPIVNVHLWYDRPVADFDFAAFLESEAQWVFNKGVILSDVGLRSAEGQEGGGYLDVSISGARQYADLSSGEIARRIIGEVAAALPRARQAQVVRHLVIKQPEATFAAAPGSGRRRPPSRTPLSNLFLAGDWTDTGWPATMEGAVRSGLACAQAIREAVARSDGSQATPALHLA